MELNNDVVPKRRVRIEIKVDDAQKSLFAKAAQLSGQGLSEFVRASAEEKARAIISRAR